MEPFKQIAIYGVGLMGASLGLAARRRGLAERVVGVGRNAERLERARELGCVESWSTAPAEPLAASDLVVLCTPVTHIRGLLGEVAAAVADGAIVTDVGSTKATLAAAAEKHFTGGAHFIGSHPIAGSEKSGAQFAREDLYEGACCFVTPSADADEGAVGRVEALWQAVGSRTILTTPARHDRLMAALSHVPHLAAVGLIETVSGLGEALEVVRDVSGKGLRDTTRVAEGPAAVWRDICRENRGEIVASLDRLLAALGELRGAIDGGDDEALLAILERAAAYRAQL